MKVSPVLRHVSVVLAATLSLGAPLRAAAAEAAEAAEGAARQGQLREANAHYERGAAAYRARKYSDAVAAFLAADRLVPSAVLSFNIARAHDKNGDALAALAHYRDYLRRDEAPKNAALVTQRIAALEAELLARGGSVLTVLTEPPSATVLLDGRPIGSTPLSAAVAPGAHRVSVERGGYTAERRDLELQPASASELRLSLVATTPNAAAPLVTPAPGAARDLTPPAQPAPEAAQRRGIGGLPLVVLGAGGAALLVSGAFELSRRSAESDARSAPTQLAYAEEYDAMRSRQTTARVLAAAGGALLIGGGILLVLDRASASEPRSAAALSWTGRSCVASFATSF